jgi:hypothetical protein
MKKFAFATASAVAMTAAAPASAALVININQVGNDLVATGSGSVNTTGLVGGGANSYSTIIRGTGGAVFVGPQRDTVFYQNAFTNTASFGNGTDVYSATGTGDTFGLYGAFGYLMLPAGYVSNTALSGTHTYANQTFASAGINTGTYVYNIANGDRVTVNIGVNATPAVPEPATWGLLVLGMGMVGAGLRTRRRSVSFSAA